MKDRNGGTINLGDKVVVVRPEPTGLGQTLMVGTVVLLNNNPYEFLGQMKPSSHIRIEFEGGEVYRYTHRDGNIMQVLKEPYHEPGEPLSVGDKVATYRWFGKGARDCALVDATVEEFITRPEPQWKLYGLDKGIVIRYADGTLAERKDGKSLMKKGNE